MEEENIIKGNKIETVNQGPLPKDLNSKVPPYFLIAAFVVLLIGIGVYFLFSKNLIPLNVSPTKSPVSVEKPQITIKTKSYELSGKKGVQIYLYSSSGSTEISAFQLKFVLPEGTKKENVDLSLNNDLENQAWKFPIARFEEEGETPVIKLSGFRLGNAPYIIKGNLLIATITTKDNASLLLTLDEGDTILYSSDAVTKIPFDSLSE